jgi:hypothetical protein
MAAALGGGRRCEGPKLRMRETKRVRDEGRRGCENDRV